MRVIVDTSVWSLALRRNRKLDVPHVTVFRDLIIDGRTALLGAVRQEILSGIRHVDHFERLKNYLRAFPDIEMSIEDYELASEFYNTCRSNGIQGANTDFLVCAAAVRRSYGILTTDKDFHIFRKHIPIVLVEP